MKAGNRTEPEDPNRLGTEPGGIGMAAEPLRNRTVKDPNCLGTEPFKNRTVQEPNRSGTESFKNC